MLGMIENFERLLEKMYKNTGQNLFKEPKMSTFAEIWLTGKGKWKIIKTNN
jgi:hypothetical protein